MASFIYFFLASILVNFSDFKPRIILKFLNTKGVTSPKNSRNLFQSLIFYYIIKLDKSLYYVSITLKYICKQYITMIKNSYVSMKLKPRIIFKLFLNFSDLSLNILINFNHLRCRRGSYWIFVF